jgi:hypothetical protein
MGGYLKVFGGKSMKILGDPHFRTSPYGKFEKNMFWVKIP